MVSLVTWFGLALLEHRVVPLAESLCREDESENGVLLAVGSEFHDLVHREVVRERGVASMCFPPKGFREDHRHSGYVGIHLILNQKTFALGNALKFDPVESGSGEADNCFLACVNYP